MLTLIQQMILNMGRCLKGYILFLCLCTLLALMGIFPLSTVITMTILLLTMLPVGGISPDTETPAAVRARYLLVLLMALTGAVFGLTAGVFLSAAGTGRAAAAFDTVFLSLSVGLLMAGILLPLNYRFGAQRSRRYLYPIVIIPMIILLWRENRGTQTDILSSGWLSVLCVFGVGISCLISCRIAEGHNERPF